MFYTACTQISPATSTSTEIFVSPNRKIRAGEICSTDTTLSGPNAVVRDSILFTDCYVEAGARVERAILDKNVTVGHNAVIGALDDSDGTLGLTAIGKNVQIAAGLTVGRGVSISPDVYLEPEPLLWPNAENPTGTSESSFG